MVKTIDYIDGFKNLVVVQDTSFFRYGTDAVLLSNYVDILPTTKKILDIGTGNAIIPLLLSTKTDAKIDAVEIQECCYKLALETVLYNDLGNQINVINDDIKNFSLRVVANAYDIIVSNPPYFNNGRQSSNISKSLARSEISLTIEDVFSISLKLLKNKGFLYIIYRVERLYQLLDLSLMYNLALKEFSLVYSDNKSVAKLGLFKFSKNAMKDGLRVGKSVYINRKDVNIFE